MWGRTCFQSQWLLVSSFKDPCPHRVGWTIHSCSWSCLSQPPPKFSWRSLWAQSRFGLAQPSTLVAPSHFFHAGFLLWLGKQGLFFHMCCDFLGVFFPQSSPKVHGWMPAFQPSGSRVQAFVLARSFLWNFLGGGPNVSLCQLWGINGWTYPEFVHWVHQQRDIPMRSMTFRYPCASVCLPFGGDAHFLLTLVVYAIPGTERPSCFLSMMVSWLDHQSFLSGPSFRGAVPFAMLVAGALGLGLVGLRRLHFLFLFCGSNPETERAPTQKTAVICDHFMTGIPFCSMFWDFGSLHQKHRESAGLQVSCVVSRAS